MHQTVSVPACDSAPELRCSLYDSDLHAWATQQSRALREGRFNDLDLPNLIDEVGGIARHERRRFEGRLERLCHQMLLWDYGSLPRTESRAVTIAHQRRRVAQVLARCPSLEVDKAGALEEGYRSGRYAALIEDEFLPLASVPEANPYTWSDVMTRAVFWPDDGGTR